MTGRPPWRPPPSSPRARPRATSSREPQVSSPGRGGHSHLSPCPRGCVGGLARGRAQSRGPRCRGRGAPEKLDRSPLGDCPRPAPPRRNTCVQGVWLHVSCRPRQKSRSCGTRAPAALHSSPCVPSAVTAVAQAPLGTARGWGVCAASGRVTRPPVPGPRQCRMPACSPRAAWAPRSPTSPGSRTAARSPRSLKPRCRQLTPKSVSLDTLGTAL